MSPLLEQFGAIDIYLFDQLLRGRITTHHRILDAGCGGGRNLVYLLRSGFDVRAIDASEDNVSRVRALYAQLAPKQGEDRVQVASVEDQPFADGAFDVIISNAVLHFARNDAHFEAMVSEMWRVLAPEGILFARLASDIGIETAVRSLGDGRYRLPDGSDRYLVTQSRLLALTERAGATLLDPIKTTNVQGLRCMTTWVMRLAG